MSSIDLDDRVGCFPEVESDDDAVDVAKLDMMPIELPAVLKFSVDPFTPFFGGGQRLVDVEVNTAGGEHRERRRRFERLGR